MIKKNLLLLGFFILMQVNAQEAVFFTSNSSKNNELPKFGLEIYNLNFIKNNEYFNFIADGYTLLGTQLHPEFIYNSSKKTQFKIGLFASKHFGDDKIYKTIPTFTFNYRFKNSLFTMGNLFARDNHNMIDPLLGSEKVLSADVLETGVQYVYKKNRFAIDTWFSWENYIEKNDDDREEFSIGISANYKILSSKKSSLSIPLQFLYYHRGGQINKKYRFQNAGDNLILNFKNLASGLVYKTSFSDYTLKIGYYYLVHTVNSIKEEFTFTNGNAHYINATLVLKKLHFSIGYFSASKFISAKGNDIFQSYSVKVDNNYWNGVLDNRYANHSEPKRSLLFTKFIYKTNLTDKITLGFQAEGYYQLNNATIPNFPQLGNTKNNFDYSYAIYLVMNDLFAF